MCVSDETRVEVRDLVFRLVYGTEDPRGGWVKHPVGQWRPENAAELWVREIEQLVARLGVDRRGS